MASNGVLYDSGSVAAGAEIATRVMETGPFSSLEIIVDNSAGNVMRDLSLVSYLSDGTTQVDSVLLRKCGFGAAASGSSYARGVARVCVGVDAKAGIPSLHTLYDVTSAADTALDTGLLHTDGMLAVWASSRGSGGTHTLTGHEIADNAAQQAVYGGGTAALRSSIHVGVGGFGPTSTGSGTSGSAPVPRRMQFTATTSGATFTTKLVVYGFGPPPGTCSVPFLFGPRTKVVLAAGDTGAARMTIIGR